MSSMTSTTDSTITCPTWCTREHDAAPSSDGWHHDSETFGVVIGERPGGDWENQLFVNASQYVPGDGLARAARVELQDERATIARLTADEAVALATALLTAAAQVRNL
jgi:hypothetical protein